MCSTSVVALLSVLLLPLALAQYPTQCIIPDQSYFSSGMWYRPNPTGNFMNQVRGSFPSTCSVNSRVSIFPRNVSLDPSQPIAVDPNGNTYYLDQGQGIVSVQYPASPKLYLPLHSIPSKTYTTGPSGIYFLVSTATGAYLIGYSWQYSSAQMLFNSTIDPSFNLANCQGNLSFCGLDNIYSGFIVLSNTVTGKFFVYDYQYGSLVTVASLPEVDSGPYYFGEVATTSASYTLIVTTQVNVYAFDITQKPVAPNMWIYPGTFNGMTMTQKHIFLTSGDATAPEFTVLDPSLGLPLWQSGATSCTPVALTTNCTIICMDTKTRALGSLLITDPPTYNQFIDYVFTYAPPAVRVLVDSGDNLATMFVTGGGSTPFVPYLYIINLSNVTSSWSVSFATRLYTPSFPALALRPGQSSSQSNVVVMAEGASQGSLYFLGGSSFQCLPSLPV